MYCSELIKCDVSCTSYYMYVEIENGALLCDISRSWKMIFGSFGKSWKIFREKCGTVPVIVGDGSWNHRMYYNSQAAWHIGCH